MLSGKMGVVVLMLAIVCTLGVAWVMSMDVNEVEVTKYASLVDITDQFETEKSPEYITYNPSTNYTGYYTDDSIIGNNRYFDGVEYTTSNPNNYRLNLAPLNYSTGVTDALSGNDWDSGARVTLMGMTQYTSTGNIAGHSWSTGTTGKDVYLTDIISSLNLDPAINWIQLSSIDALDALDEPLSQVSPLSVDWVIFSDKSMWLDDALRVQLPDYFRDKAESAEFKPQQPMLSCTVNLEINQVTIYYDNGYSNQVGIFNIDTVIVSFGGSGSGVSALHLGTTVNYDYGTIADPEYMEPSQGVSL